MIRFHAIIHGVFLLLTIVISVAIHICKAEEAYTETFNDYFLDVYCITSVIMFILLTRARRFKLQLLFGNLALVIIVPIHCVYRLSSILLEGGPVGFSALLLSIPSINSVLLCCYLSVRLTYKKSVK